MAYVYRIVYPSGMSYIGSDLTDDSTYFGSATGWAAELPLAQGKEHCIRKQILWYRKGRVERKKDNCNFQEVLQWEAAYIKAFNTMQPNGYNQKWPRKLDKVSAKIRTEATKRAEEMLK